MKIDKNKLEEFLNKKIKLIEKIGNGGHNFMFKVEFEDSTLQALRLYGKHQYDFCKKEFEVLESLKHFKNITKTYHICEDESILGSKFLLIEYIRGKTLNEFNDNSTIFLGNFLQNLHKIKIEKKSEININYDSFLSEIFPLNKIFFDKYREKFILIKNKYHEYLMEFKSYLNLENNLSLLHNDLIPENIIKTKNTYYLIDWELSKYGHKLEEFGSILLETEISKKHLKLLIESYGLSEKEKSYLHHVKVDRTFGMLHWFFERIIMELNSEKLDDFGMDYIAKFDETLDLLLNGINDSLQ